MLPGALEKTRILALETSGRRGSVAVALGRELLAVEPFGTDRNHAVELLPMVDRLTRQVGWAPEQVDDVFVSAGPGSFTGLRVGITVARTLALATGARVVRVSTVEVLACNALAMDPPPASLAVVLDAKRSQVYGAVFRFEAGRYQTVTEACVMAPDELLATAQRPVAVLGEGVPYHREAIDRIGADVLPEEHWPAQAEHVHAVGCELAARGQYANPRDLIPIYLRRPEAEEKWEQRHGG